MLVITNLRCLTLDIDYIDVAWEAAPGADPHDYTFQVLRSEAEFGPYIPVSRTFKDRYRFRDSSAPQRHLLRHWYYRIRVTRLSDSVQEHYPPVDLPGVTISAKPDLVALEIARQTRLRLKEFEGRQVWVLPVRTFGLRCTNCYDATTQQRVRSKCSGCFGTGFVGGYLAPVQCYMSITSPDTSLQVSDMAAMTPIKGRGKLGNYPSLHDDDLVVESENKRWRVFGVQEVMKQRAVVRQEFGLEGISTSDDAYRVPLRVDLDELDPTAPRQYTNPQSLDWEAERYGYKD